jgi:hypothetical protein
VLPSPTQLLLLLLRVLCHIASCVTGWQSIQLQVAGLLAACGTGTRCCRIRCSGKQRSDCVGSCCRGALKVMLSPELVPSPVTMRGQACARVRQCLLLRRERARQSPRQSAARGGAGGACGNCSAAYRLQGVTHCSLVMWESLTLSFVFKAEVNARDNSLQARPRCLHWHAVASLSHAFTDASAQSHVQRSCGSCRSSGCQLCRHGHTGHVVRNSPLPPAPLRSAVPCSCCFF